MVVPVLIGLLGFQKRETMTQAIQNSELNANIYLFSFLNEGEKHHATRINVERLMHSFPVLMVVCGMRSNMDHIGYGNIISES